ncbi:hypothetical protein IEO21_01245 [Rhodonia placenta]|uniref:Uncharacterized protein n=1 Tax=Rhodonia placenta TaxID=104341 RepID=A0A8H7P9V7_9APHY|nr:hypothetical protein IEO21_01245 [Postia placenta]
MARTRDIDQEEEKGSPYCLVEDGGSKRHARLVPEKAGISSSVANIAPAAPAYPFLSQPPPQKKRPTQPLPTTPVQAPASPCKPVANRRRSATLSVIAAWAANETVSKAKKSKYAKYRPPPLAAELALAQLADGGKMDDHIRRFAEAQARAGGAMVVDGKLVGVGDVWRDGEGGVWRDQDEEWEYAHLLGGDDQLRASDGGWERFGSGSASNSADGEEHRGSVSSQDSDLDPRYAMQAEGERDDLAVFGSAVMPSAMRKPGMSVLAIPTRHRRTAPHLRKPEFLLDVFPVPDNADAQPLSQLSSNGQQARATGKERRRPAPLTLPPPSPASKAPMNPLDDTRKAFIENSFAPPPAPSPATHRQHHQRPVEPPRTPARVDSRPTTVRKMAFGGKSTIKMDMRGLLKVMGGKRDI